MDPTHSFPKIGISDWGAKVEKEDWQVKEVENVKKSRVNQVI